MDGLEKQLICPVCLEMFTKPVVILPCQHNLCRKCAGDVLQSSYLPTLAGGRFRCPSCRHEVLLDRHGVYGLPRNLLVENIVDTIKQQCVRPSAERTLVQPMCVVHQDEKINIFCMSCSVPTCSMCKVFGSHRACEVSPLSIAYATAKTELLEGMAVMQRNTDRMRLAIGQLEENCRTIEDDSRLQRSEACEKLERLRRVLEQKKVQMKQRLAAEQQQKLTHIRSLAQKLSGQLEATGHALQTGIQMLEEPEMAVFLQGAKALMQTVMMASDLSHLEQVERGYESLRLYTVSIRREAAALKAIRFQSDKQKEEEEEEGADAEGRAEQTALGGSDTLDEALPPLLPPHTHSIS